LTNFRTGHRRGRGLFLAEYNGIWEFPLPLKNFDPFSRELDPLLPLCKKPSNTTLSVQLCIYRTLNKNDEYVLKCLIMR